MRPKNPMTITWLFYSLGGIFEKKNPTSHLLLFCFFTRYYDVAPRGGEEHDARQTVWRMFSRERDACAHGLVRTRTKSVLLLLILRSGRPRTTTGYTGAKRRRRINRTRFRRRSRQVVCVMTPNNGRKQSKTRGTEGGGEENALKKHRKLLFDYVPLWACVFNT